MSNPQARKWILTQNNPHSCGLDREAITEILMKFFPTYFCMADEIGENGTYHTHIFLYSTSPIRFGTIKTRFPTAHIEKSFGTCQQNKDYVMKSGKWENDAKSETRVEGTFFEYGKMPAEKEEENPKMSGLIRHIKDGMRTAEIIDDTPNYAFRVREIDTLRQVLLSERYAVENRDLTVTYIYGAAGSGKTRGIYARHDPRDIYRLTNYRTGRGLSFDGYNGQPVLVFEEFSSKLVKIEDMLNFLDVYPLYLPARYYDKTACYSIAYLTANIPLAEQYKDVQTERPETWRAFLRRIHKVVEYKSDGTTIETILNEKGGVTL